MKTLIGLVTLAILATAWASPAVNVEEAKNSHDRFLKAHQNCNENEATKVESLRNIREGPKPKNLGAHLLCISQNLKWQNADGTPNRERIHAGAAKIYGEHPKLQELVNECSQNKNNPEETALHVYECYEKNFPKRPEPSQH